MYYNSATGDVHNDFMEPLIPEIKDCYTDVPYKINKEKYFELFEKEVAKRNIITNRLKKNLDVVQFTFGITIDDKEKPTARSLFVWPKNLKTYDVFIFHSDFNENFLKDYDEFTKELVKTIEGIDDKYLFKLIKAKTVERNRLNKDIEKLYKLKF